MKSFKNLFGETEAMYVKIVQTALKFFANNIFENGLCQLREMNASL